MDPTPLYQPQDVQNTATFRFLASANAKLSLNMTSYEDLYQWSTTHLDDFWGMVWDETGVIGTKGDHVVDTSAAPPANPTWFSGAKLNWPRTSEPTLDNPTPDLQKCTYWELYTLVADLVSALLDRGLKPGDRVASYSSNCIENVAACLATVAVGGIWVSAAADFGPEGVLERSIVTHCLTRIADKCIRRFEQVQPRFIFAVDAVVYNGKVHNHLPKLTALLAGLSDTGLPSPDIIIIHSARLGNGWLSWADFVTDGHKCKLGRTTSGEIEWYRCAFDTPLWILFSSGTTGRPKPIVHRSGGMLLQAKKELMVCGDLQPTDVFFYYTTTGWMMWNFLVSGLTVGCTLILYDGSPLKDPALLWNLVDALKITIFGTSAKYIDQLSKKYRPREHHSLQTLKHIYSTGSPLAPPLFDYVYEHIHPNVLLGSITGGTDICSLFAGMCSALPVYRGEIQCRMLGMAIESFTPTGKLCPRNEPGELVCIKPFPCMPLGFWPLPGFGNEGDVTLAQARYQMAYFSEFQDVWYHGDHIIVTHSREGNAGGLLMLGRSDGVLNPGGIRFGSSELYDVIDLCFSSTAGDDFVVDCIAVGQKIEGGTDERVVLFVKLLEGQKLDSGLETKIRSEVRKRRSPRHVPARIIQVYDIPYTLNGKRVEVLVKKIINGAPLSSVNLATLSNPGCLQFYAEIGTILREEVKLE
ncbi:acetoacyl-CoA synthetase [Infundibulicybe gibba]|nr:acetoacyl-CoA synthetase [Infundibulicybe gibba]